MRWMKPGRGWTAWAGAEMGSSHVAPDDMLLAYATGSLNEPLSLLVESHAELNPESRRRLAAYEAIGGVLLEELPPAPLCPQALGRTLERCKASAGDAVVRI